MLDCNLYSKCQHGFKKHRSCITQLLEAMEDFANFVDNKNDIDIIYLDLQKAFDQVPHRILLHKLNYLGITGNIHKWMSDFLKDRNQRVRVGNLYSEPSQVTSGIPQGSIIGPILFTIFINDLPDCVSSCCKIFANDTKLYDVASNCTQIHKDIDALKKSSDKWNLYFNADKCKVMHIGLHNQRFDYTMKLSNEEIVNIMKCDEEKDLGVVFDCMLSFDSHIQTVINKANRNIGIIRRTFSYLTQNGFIQLYKALARPHLEYGNAIWHPHLKRQSTSVEKIQRRATRLLFEVNTLTYGEILIFLKLPSLKFRRTREDMIQVFKIINGLDDLNWIYFFIKAVPNVTKHSEHKLFVRYSRTNKRKNTFSIRVVPVWNGLCQAPKSADTVNILFNRLNKRPQPQCFHI